MDAAAKAVMEEFPDIVLAFGESDEYSYVIFHHPPSPPLPLLDIRSLVCMRIYLPTHSRISASFSVVPLPFTRGVNQKS